MGWFKSSDEPEGDVVETLEIPEVDVIQARDLAQSHVGGGIELYGAFEKLVKVESGSTSVLITVEREEYREGARWGVTQMCWSVGPHQVVRVRSFGTHEGSKLRQV